MNRFCSIFCQILQLFSRIDFEKAVREHRANRHERGFRCWTQFVAMLFCQLGRANSLREITGGLASCEGKIAHLGISNAPKRSTLSYANEHRPWQVYQTVFFQLLQNCKGAASGVNRKFRFKNRLLSLDSTIIDLCATLYDWAKFRRTKGAIKLHLILDHEGYLPCFAVITQGGLHDIKVARQLKFEPDTLLVVDRGYNDYELFYKWNQSEVFFFTRMKTNASYRVMKNLDFKPKTGVRKDQLIQLSGRGAEKYPMKLRRVEYYDKEQERTLVFLTNHLEFAASSVARVYKERWQIELFFKALKQNLKIKTFVGTSANALKIQVWTALIAMLILRYLQLRSSFGWSLSNLVALLRMNLFTHRDFWAWLDKPYSTPPLPNDTQQSFSFGKI